LDYISGALGTSPSLPGQPGESADRMQQAYALGQLVPVPGSPGVYLDPQTGNTVTGQVLDGQFYGTRNNQALPGNLAALQSAQSAGLLGQQQGTFAQLGGVAGQLGALANAPAGPSVAEQQLQAGHDAAVGSQLALVSGADGANAGLAARQAAQNIASAQTATNQQAAQLRAAEAQQQVQNRLAALTAQGSVLNQISGQQGGEATSFAGTAGNAATGQLNAQEDNAKAKAQGNSNLLGGAGSALATIAAL
jgi:hypothetical protein